MNANDWKKENTHTWDDILKLNLNLNSWTKFFLFFFFVFVKCWNMCVYVQCICRFQFRFYDLRVRTLITYTIYMHINIKEHRIHTLSLALHCVLTSSVASTNIFIFFCWPQTDYTSKSNVHFSKIVSLSIIGTVVLILWPQNGSSKQIIKMPEHKW